jgi:hypothetical protein
MGDATVGSLSRLQRFIVEAVRKSEDPKAGADGASEAERLLVPGKRGLRPADRLEIYREQFWLRHVSNLVDDFPTLGWVVGATTFRELASAYLVVHPPRTWNLQRLGANLHAYMANEPRWAGDPLAMDACRLDWAFMEAFDAPDAGPLDLGPLANAPEDALTAARLTFHPSIRRLVLEHAVHELRDAVKRGDACGRPEANGVRLVVWRDATFALNAAAVEPIAFELLAELAAGTPLGRACEAVANAHSAGDDVGERVGAWFQQWTANGWVSAIDLGP